MSATGEKDAVRYRRLLKVFFSTDVRRVDGEEMEAVFLHLLVLERRRLGRLGSARAWARAVLDGVWNGWLRRRPPAKRLGGPTTKRGNGTMLLWTNLRLAARTLRRRPLFTTVAVLSLAVGIGGNTAIFSIVNALLLKPLPGIPREASLVELGRGRDGSGFDTFAYPDFTDIRDGAPALADASVYRMAVLALRQDGRGERVNAMYVSSNYFDVMGLAPALGSLFDATVDFARDFPHVVVVSRRLWMDRLGGRPDIVGSTILVNRTPFTVVGVGPERFRGHVVGLVADVWLPLGIIGELERREIPLSDRGSVWLQAMGRLAPGATLEELKVEMAAIGARLAGEYPESNLHRTFSAAHLGPVPALFRSAVSLFLGVLMGMACLILLVTCTNVAGMFLARADEREREMAIRLSIGAGRSALLSQLTIESLIVFLLGGGGGVLLAYWAVGLVRPESVPLPGSIDFDVSPDASVLVFALIVTLGTGIVFALVPALHATRLDLVSSLKTGGSHSPRTTRLRKAFVATQVGFSVVLMVVAGLFLRSLASVASADQGFDPDGVFMTDLDLDLEGYGSADEGRAVQRRILELVSALGSVESAGLTTDMPLDLSRSGGPAVPEGWNSTSGDARFQTTWAMVSEGYLETLRIRVLRGRSLSEADDARSRPVAVVSRAFASRAWPGSDPVGLTFTLPMSSAAYTVVGVVEDVKTATVTDAKEPMAYVPLEQVYRASTSLVVRAHGDPRDVARVLRAAILEVDPRLTFTPVVSVARYTSIGTLPQRLAAEITLALGLLAATLTALGIYGVVAYGVRRRSREIAIRMTLGAGRTSVVRDVVCEGLHLALPGLVGGAVLAAGAAFAVRNLILGVDPADPWMIAGVTVAVATMVGVASWLPARGASMMAPGAALHME